MSLYKQYTLQHVRTTEGRAGTDRVHLDFESKASSAFLQFLEKQCDDTGIQGVLGVFRVQEGPGKVLLIISNTVVTEATAPAWITEVNEAIRCLDEETLMGFLRGFTPDEALAVSASSSSGVSIQADGGSSDA